MTPPATDGDEIQRHADSDLRETRDPAAGPAADASAGSKVRLTRRSFLGVFSGAGIIGSVGGGERLRSRRDHQLSVTAVADETPPETRWAQKYHKNANDWIFSVIEVSDGGYLLAGSTASGETASDGDYLVPDAWLVRVNSEGAFQWEQTYGGDDRDMAHSILEASDGGYLLAGRTKSSGSGGDDAWLLRVDNEGTLQWKQSYGGSDNDRAYSLIEASDGGYLLAGSTASNYSENGAWLVKVDGEGTLQWEQTYGGNDDDRAYSLIEASDGGYLLAGRKSGGEAWLIRTDTEGIIQWQQTYRQLLGSTRFSTTSVIEASDGGYLLAGCQSGAWLLKVDGEGALQWEQTYAGADLAFSMTEASDGGYLLSGQTRFNDGDEHAWLGRVDGEGALQWEQNYGSSFHDAAHSIITTTDGGFLFAGRTEDQGTDGWLVKIGGQPKLTATTDPSGTATVTPTQTDAAEVGNDGDVDSDPTDSDSADSDPTDSDPTDSDPTDSNPADSNPADSNPDEEAPPLRDVFSVEGLIAVGGALLLGLVGLIAWDRRSTGGGPDGSAGATSDNSGQPPSAGSGDETGSDGSTMSTTGASAASNPLNDSGPPATTGSPNKSAVSTAARGGKQDSESVGDERPAVTPDSGNDESTSDPIEQHPTQAPPEEPDSAVLERLTQSLDETLADNEDGTELADLSQEAVLAAETLVADCLPTGPAATALEAARTHQQNGNYEQALERATHVRDLADHEITQLETVRATASGTVPAVDLEALKAQTTQHDLDTDVTMAYEDLTDNIDRLDPGRLLGAGPSATVPSAPAVSLTYDAIEKTRHLGTGGSADVFEASIDTPEGAVTIALKEPRLESDVDPDVIEEFEREADTWARLDGHDNIVGVVDWGTDPHPWIAMEYMDGGPLTALAGQLTPRQAIWTLLETVRGVYYAHRRGVAHLDLKPGNVLLRTTGEESWPVPKVADWGLAKVLLEHTRSVQGYTPLYAAPEQIDADRFGAPDTQTDIYQLGAIGYTLAAGRPPFTGEAAEIVYNIIDTDVPPLTTHAPGVPNRLDAILQTALAKDRTDRYESLIYLRDDLQELYDSL